MHVRFQLRIALMLLLPVLLAGCGYRWVRYRADGEPRAISVVTLKNDSDEAGVELIISEALRREILNRGALRLVREPGGADLVVRGAVRGLTTRRRSFTGVNLAREYQVTMRLELSLEDLENSLPLISSVEFIASEIYLASADAEAGRKNRREALVYLSGLMARRIHDSMDRELLSATRAAQGNSEPGAGEVR